MLISYDKISKNTNLMEERDFFHFTVLEILGHKDAIVDSTALGLVERTNDRDYLMIGR